MANPSEPEPTPLLSVVIPAFNEIRTLQQILAAVQAVDVDKEIIVVDDFSTDGTRECLQEIANKDGSPLRALYHDRNLGKGAALRTGFAAARGTFVVQDADVEYDPNEYPKLLKPLLEDRADIVFGSRFIGNDEHRVLYYWHSLGNRVLTSFSNMFTNLNLSDMETGYKVFRRDILQQITLEEDRFGFEPEITAKVARYRKNGQPLRIYEMGISYYGRTCQERKNWLERWRASAF